MFTLLDRMSGPSNRIAQSLKRVSWQMQDGTKTTFAFGKSTDAASGGLMAMGANLGGWMSIASKAVDVVVGLGTAIGDAAYSFMSFGVNALATKESLLKSFELMLGSADKANEFFRSAVDFAAITPFETKDVVDQYKRLLAAGFKQEEVPIVFQAVGDVAAMNNFSADTMNSITRAFGQMKGRGKLLTEELYQVLEGSNGAIRRDAVFENIAKELNIGVTEVQAAISAGKVDSNTGIFAILKAIQDTTSGGELGKGMEIQAGTIKGLFSTIASIPSDIFYRMDMSKIPGLDAFKGFLENIISLFDMTKRDGQELMAIVQEVFSDTMQAAFGALSGPEGMKNLKALFRTLLEGAKTGWKVIEGLASGFRAFWNALSPSLEAFGVLGREMGGLGNTGDVLKEQLTHLGGALGTLVGWLVQLVTLPAQIAAGFVKLKNDVMGLGQSITTGLTVGLNAGAFGPIGAVLGMAKGIYDAAAGPQGVDAGSPSRKFEQLGLWSAQGFQQGLTKGTGAATAAATGLVTAGSTGNGAGGGAPQVTVHLSIDARGNTAAEEIGRLVEHMLPSAITRAFEQLAMGGGVSEEPVTS